MLATQRLFILLRPLVYVLALVSVFLLLVSSIDLDVPFLSRDIIDSVRIIFCILPFSCMPHQILTRFFLNQTIVHQWRSFNIGCL